MNEPITWWAILPVLMAFQSCQCMNDGFRDNRVNSLEAEVSSLKSETSRLKSDLDTLDRKHRDLVSTVRRKQDSP